MSKESSTSSPPPPNPCQPEPQKQPSFRQLLKTKFSETIALLADEQGRSRHLTSNWFHQTWKLHCYLVFCQSGNNKSHNKKYMAHEFFVEDFLG